MTTPERQTIQLDKNFENPSKMVTERHSGAFNDKKKQW
jgi:hypothetical protein